MNCGVMGCRVLWLHGHMASCAKGLDSTVQTSFTGVVLSCSRVDDNSGVFQLVGQCVCPLFQLSLILATIPKISLHSLIHWFLPSTTIYWSEAERG